MKVTCTRENLHKALSMVGRIVGNRASLPVLGNVLLTTEKGRLKISTTDLEIGLTTRIGAKVDTEGSITVPSRTLSEFVASVGGDNLTLTVDKLVMTVKADNAKATLRGIDAEEFPVIPTIESDPTLVVHGQTLLQAIKQVVIAAATDETRPVLAGMLIKWDGKEMRCVATDSYRLAEKVIGLEKEVKEKGEVIVPARSINELARVVGVIGSETIAVSLQENQILFTFDDSELVSRLIEGKYPDYAKIIPQTKATTATFEAEDFKSVVRTASIFARESANTVKLKFAEGKITVAALAEQLGDASADMVAEITGEDAESSFNVRFLSDAATAISDDKIEFALSGKFQASLIQGVKSPDFKYVIMPLRTE